MADFGLCNCLVQKFCVKQQFRFSLPFCHNDCFTGAVYYLSQVTYLCLITDSAHQTRQTNSITTESVQLFKVAKLSDCP